MPPQVRDLQKLIAEQQAGLAPQYGLIDQDIQANDNSGQAQELGLRATAGQEYKKIEQTAQNKGMFFSGFSPDKQAEYNATTFMPALAQLQATIAQTRGSLFGKKADLGTRAFDKATGMREQDLQTLSDWQKMTAQQQFQASESDKQRVFEAQQNEKQIQAQERASIRSSSASAAADKGPSNQELFAAQLAQNTGNDGKVSPGTYNALKQQWVASGYGDYKSFHDKYWKFANDKYWWDYR